MGFFPKKPKCFCFFDELAEMVQEAGKILQHFKIGSSDKTKYARKATKLEHQADNVCHRLYHDTDSSFITPIDREDIHLLAHNLDDIIDLIENITSNVILYRISKENTEYKEFTKIISQATNKIHALIKLLKGQAKHITQMRKLIIEIHTLENKGDTLIRQALASLFANHTNPTFIIKWKDIFENMEKVMDECENAANIVDRIIVKNF